ncbi:mediator of DNA damage checkpoint protein 1-like isoform X1 [Acipenser ruthenus]|uniref:mediator of DNA damage checkpoint protein 1-like isoform X1 n=2 Tax=Acipenser ruthenus TaxID=7906 RepID=UPI0027411C34|nr:mediator of DNA damage checkpoint protein 1-like isoform X1 [Acipenser ruthenus]XP_058866791.1 mediator of DNA damage checkpoint protein 1-like isoform X1 [Acipenser ruthenus]XP_058866792.1 mediator of DNA damage checkpoint protein 1-like isoform X1 [Acipenser ruthenus]
MDQTQLLEEPLSAEEEEQGVKEDSASEGSQKLPMGRLRLFSNAHCKETDFQLFAGENTVGREESCAVALLAGSVSKRHAVIEIERGSHLLWDCGSLNGTRKGRTQLKPRVRYDLQDAELLVFADLPCQYFILPPGRASETANQTACYLRTANQTAVSVRKKEAGPASEFKTPSTKNVGSDPVETTVPPKASEGLIERTANGSAKLQGMDPAMERPANQKAEEGNNGGRGGGIRMVDSGDDDDDDDSLMLPDTQAHVETRSLALEETPAPSKRGFATPLVVDSEEEEGERKLTDTSAGPGPINSTFLSPGATVIPESEDESSITPGTSPNVQASKGQSTTRSKGVKPMPLLVSSDTDSEDLAAQKGHSKSKLKTKRPAEQRRPAAGKTRRERSASEGPQDSGSGAEQLNGTKGQEEKAAWTRIKDQPVSEHSGYIQRSEEKGVQAVGRAPGDETVGSNEKNDTDSEELEGRQGEGSRSENSKGEKALAVFQLDSDTDIEEEEEEEKQDKEKTDSAAAAGSGNQVEVPELRESAVPSAPVELDAFHLDSDTDVEQEEDEQPVGEPSTSAVKAALNADSMSEQQPQSGAGPTMLNAFHVDSDTDADEGEKEQPVEDSYNSREGCDVDASSKERSSTATAAPGPVTLNVFHLDSDTDVDEDDVEEQPVDESCSSATKAGLDVDASTGQQASTTPIAPAEVTAFHLDSDTDVEEEDEVKSFSSATKAGLDVVTLAEQQAPSTSTTSAPGLQSMIQSDSDTGVEDEADLSKADATAEIEEGKTGKPSSPPEKDATSLHDGSDTDVEEENLAPKAGKTGLDLMKQDNDSEAEAGAAADTSRLDEEATQAFIFQPINGGDQGAFKQPFASDFSRRSLPSISGAPRPLEHPMEQSDEEDIVVAETQSFCTDADSSDSVDPALEATQQYECGLDQSKETEEEPTQAYSFDLGTEARATQSGGLRLALSEGTETEPTQEVTREADTQRLAQTANAVESAWSAEQEEATLDFNCVLSEASKPTTDLKPTCASNAAAHHDAETQPMLFDLFDDTEAAEDAHIQRESRSTPSFTTAETQLIEFETQEHNDTQPVLSHHQPCESRQAQSVPRYEMETAAAETQPVDSEAAGADTQPLGFRLESQAESLTSEDAAVEAVQFTSETSQTQLGSRPEMESVEESMQDTVPIRAQGHSRGPTTVSSAKISDDTSSSAGTTTRESEEPSVCPDASTQSISFQTYLTDGEACSNEQEKKHARNDDACPVASTGPVPLTKDTMAVGKTPEEISSQGGRRGNKGKEGRTDGAEQKEHPSVVGQAAGDSGSNLSVEDEGRSKGAARRGGRLRLGRRQKGKETEAGKEQPEGESNVASGENVEQPAVGGRSDGGDGPSCEEGMEGASETLIESTEQVATVEETGPGREEHLSGSVEASGSKSEQEDGEKHDEEEGEAGTTPGGLSSRRKSRVTKQHTPSDGGRAKAASKAAASASGAGRDLVLAMEDHGLENQQRKENEEPQGTKEPKMAPIFLRKSMKGLTSEAQVTPVRRSGRAARTSTALETPEASLAAGRVGGLRKKRGVTTAREEEKNKEEEENVVEEKEHVGLKRRRTAEDGGDVDAVEILHPAEQQQPSEGDSRQSERELTEEKSSEVKGRGSSRRRLLSKSDPVLVLEASEEEAANARGTRQADSGYIQPEPREQKKTLEAEKKPKGRGGKRKLASKSDPLLLETSEETASVSQEEVPKARGQKQAKSVLPEGSKEAASELEQFEARGRNRVRLGASEQDAAGEVPEVRGKKQASLSDSFSLEAGSEEAFKVSQTEVPEVQMEPNEQEASEEVPVGKGKRARKQAKTDSEASVGEVEQIPVPRGRRQAGSIQLEANEQRGKGKKKPEESKTIAEPKARGRGGRRQTRTAGNEEEEEEQLQPASEGENFKVPSVKGKGGRVSRTRSKDSSEEAAGSKEDTATGKTATSEEPQLQTEAEPRVPEKGRRRGRQAKTEPQGQDAGPSEIEMDSSLKGKGCRRGKSTASQREVEEDREDTESNASANSEEQGDKRGRKQEVPRTPSPQGSTGSASSTRKRRPQSLVTGSQDTPPDFKTPRRSVSRASITGVSPRLTGSSSVPKIQFTGVIDDCGLEVIERLGGEMAESGHDCTHLITDRVRRTVKFLCAVARGIPIVTPEWLEKCGKNGCFLSPNAFLVKDVEQEKNFSFSLADSLIKARRQSLLEGYEVHVTPNVKPEPAQMKEIIQCSGASYLPKMPKVYKDRTVVISCVEDAAKCKAALGASIPVVNAEFLLTGILQQSAELQRYSLQGPGFDRQGAPAHRTSTAGGRRRR